MNNTAKISGLNYKEAVSLIDSSNFSKKNKEDLKLEMEEAIIEKVDNDYRVDHTRILENYAEKVT